MDGGLHVDVTSIVGYWRQDDITREPVTRGSASRSSGHVATGISSSSSSVRRPRSRSSCRVRCRQLATSPRSTCWTTGPSRRATSAGRSSGGKARHGPPQHSGDHEPPPASYCCAVLACQACGHLNPDGLGFCGACGTELVATAAREVRKIVTDVTGSTGLWTHSARGDCRTHPFCRRRRRRLLGGPRGHGLGAPRPQDRASKVIDWRRLRQTVWDTGHPAEPPTGFPIASAHGCVIARLPALPT